MPLTYNPMVEERRRPVSVGPDALLPMAPSQRGDEDMAFPGGGDLGMEMTEPFGMPASQGPTMGGAAFLAGERQPKVGPRGPGVSPPQPGKMEQAPASFEALSPEAITNYRTMMRERYPNMPDQQFNMYFGMALKKRLGKIGAQRSKELSKPLSRYMALMQRETNARDFYQSMAERLRPLEMQMRDPRTGELDPEWARHQGALDAARSRWQNREKQRRELGAYMEQLGVPSKMLGSPITLYEYMRSLHGAPPPGASDYSDFTPDDLQGDDEDDEVDGFLQ
jgi:hypothetical protein